MNRRFVGTSRVGFSISKFRVGVALTAAAALLAFTAHADAAAGQVRVGLRVVDPAGRQVVDAVVHTSSTKVRTSREALCFGEGTGGSGGFAPTAARRPNAMGLLADAAAELGVLRPLRVSDFYSFGQTLCGIGGVEASGLLYWAIWVDDGFVEASADHARVRNGQQVVFHLTEEYPSSRIPDPAAVEGRLPVVGAPGSFPVAGTGGSDRVLARDGAKDSITCSAGEDLVFADRTDRVGADCEVVRRG